MGHSWSCSFLQTFASASLRRSAYRLILQLAAPTLIIQSLARKSLDKKSYLQTCHSTMFLYQAILLPVTVLFILGGKCAVSAVSDGDAMVRFWRQAPFLNGPSRLVFDSNEECTMASFAKAFARLAHTLAFLIVAFYRSTRTRRVLLATKDRVPCAPRVRRRR